MVDGIDRWRQDIIGLQQLERDMDEWEGCSWGCPKCGSETVVEKWKAFAQLLRCQDCDWAYTFDVYNQELPRSDRDGPNPPQVDSKDSPKPDYAAVDIDLRMEEWAVIEESTCDACGEQRPTVELKSFSLDGKRRHICRGGCEERT